MELCKKGYDIVHPSVVSSEGGASEGWSFSRKAIKTVYKYLLKFGKKMDTFDTEMIDTFVKQKNLKKTILKGQKYELKNARLTLDYKEDYKLLKKIVEKKGGFASRKKINIFLRNNKHLLKINFKKTLDWKKKQNAFKFPTIKYNA